MQANENKPEVRVSDPLDKDAEHSGDTVYETPQVDEEELALMDRAFFDKIAVRSAETQTTSSSWSSILPVLMFLVVGILAVVFFIFRNRAIKK